MSPQTAAPELGIEIPAAFGDLFQPERYKVYPGGRGSAKSWGFSSALVVQAYQRPLRILCAREFQNSIEDSVLRTLSDTIERYGLQSFFTIQKTSIAGRNGSLFFFEGLRSNARRIKSLEGIDICWVEEADAVSAGSWDILVPTIRKDGSEIWISFNPDLPDDPTYQRFVVSPPDGAIVHPVTYRDNPWFPEVLRREMEWDRAHDPEKYYHVWEGEPRRFTKAQVFAGKYVIQDFETPHEVSWLIGGDWGFSQDPTTVVRMFVKGGKLWVDREAYGVGVELEETPALYDSVLPAKKWPVRADSARPETISFLNRRGYNVIAAKKGAGSVEDGIEFLRSFEQIVVHPRCKHTADELKLYSYKVDRTTGDVLPILVDKHNHCIDSMRYATEPLRGKRLVLV